MNLMWTEATHETAPPPGGMMNPFRLISVLIELVLLRVKYPKTLPESPDPATKIGGRFSNVAGVGRFVHLTAPQ